MKLNLVALAFILCLASGCASGLVVPGDEAAAKPSSDSLSLQIKEAVTANLKVTQDEDVDAIMSTMHSLSPSRAATKA